ncbi:MAG TPA: hypothetical protein VII85_00350 [Candidatus Krumholzibacteriaceae bacterium]
MKEEETPYTRELKEFAKYSQSRDIKVEVLGEICLPGPTNIAKRIPPGAIAMISEYELEQFTVPSTKFPHGRVKKAKDHDKVSSASDITALFVRKTASDQDDGTTLRHEAEVRRIAEGPDGKPVHEHRK